MRVTMTTSRAGFQLWRTTSPSTALTPRLKACAPPFDHHLGDLFQQNPLTFPLVLLAEKIRIAISEITAIIGDTFEDAEIADALLYYKFDKEKVITWLLDGLGIPSSFSWDADLHFFFSSFFFFFFSFQDKHSQQKQPAPKAAATTTAPAAQKKAPAAVTAAGM